MEIRRLKKKEINEVMAIANDYIAHTTIIWQREERTKRYYRRWMAAHQGRYAAFAAIEDGVLIGYSALSPFRAPVSGFDRIGENSVYIRPEFQGRGAGDALMKVLIEEARKQGFWAITAWIDSENENSLRFHEKFGFYETGVMRNIGNKNGRRLSTYSLQLDIQ
jgi:phosphinothricin acetyltransferase